MDKTPWVDHGRPCNRSLLWEYSCQKPNHYLHIWSPLKKENNNVLICSWTVPATMCCDLHCSQTTWDISINHGSGGRISRAGKKGILIALGFQPNT